MCFLMIDPAIGLLEVEEIPTEVSVGKRYHQFSLSTKISMLVYSMAEPLP